MKKKSAQTRSSKHYGRIVKTSCMVDKCSKKPITDVKITVKSGEYCFYKFCKEHTAGAENIDRYLENHPDLSKVEIIAKHK